MTCTKTFVIYSLYKIGKMQQPSLALIGSHDWFASYLSGRKQRIVINDRKSDDFHLNCGVPQGSCLGPVLFILSISWHYHVIANHLPSAHWFADDTQLDDSFSQDRALPLVAAFPMSVHG